MTEYIVARARELRAGITPGKWEVNYESTEEPPFERYAYAILGPKDHTCFGPNVSDSYREQYGHQITEIVGLSDEDAEFIAASPELVDGLLAEVERLRGALDRARFSLGAAWDDGNACGLDGWIGPDRGEKPDDEAIRLRERCIGGLLRGDK